MRLRKGGKKEFHDRMFCHMAVGIVMAMVVGSVGGVMPEIGTVKYAMAYGVYGESDNENNSAADSEQNNGINSDADSGQNDGTNDDTSGETNENLVVTELAMTANTKSTITLSWNASQTENVCYYIYQYSEEEQNYVFVGDTRETQYKCSNLTPARKYYYSVRAIDEVNGVQGQISAPVEVYTKPDKIGELVISKNNAASIKISWNAVEGADGYEIYHATPNEAFVLAGTVPVAVLSADSGAEYTYTDTGLSSGTTYRYKVRAYSFNQENTGAFCTAVKTSTLPAKPTVSVKGGEGKARVTWNAVTGAAGYYLSWYDGTEYQYVAALAGKSNTSYVHTGLQNGEYAKYKVEAYRVVNETEYKSKSSEEKQALVEKQKATVTTARLFTTKARFKKSAAYQKCTEFSKTVNYEKSYVIPGLAGTNTDGFYTSSMCPQGITFAGSYLLISAYDTKQEENSVLYVMDKSSRKLLLTLVLPTKTHAGGVTYDGYNVWVTQSSRVHAIPIKEIKNAVASGVKTYSVEYKATCELTHAASTLTYYKGMLWAASYDELAEGYLGAYSIQNKKTTPTLEKTVLIRIPTRVQGIAFTGGKLVLSRSCQTNALQRGFLHILDVYKPDLSELSNGKMKLGNLKKTIDMPTMNEEVAVSGNYLYVNFESAAFTTAVRRMDRVCALKISKLME